METSRNQLIFEYISKRENEHVSNSQISQDLGIDSQIVARVLHYGLKKCKSLFKVRRGVWVFNPEEEIKTEKAKIIQLVEIFEQKPTLSSTEISEKLGIPHRQVSQMVNRIKQEIGAEISSESHYTFKGWN